VKPLPLPGDSAQIFPSWALMILAAIYNPKPVRSMYTFDIPLSLENFSKRVIFSSFTLRNILPKIYNNLEDIKHFISNIFTKHLVVYYFSDKNFKE